EEEAAMTSPESDEPSDAPTVVVFYRVDEGESLRTIATRFGIRQSRIVADNHLDPEAKLQKGMLLKLRVPRAAVSRLASVRPLDGSSERRSVADFSGLSSNGARLP